MSNQRRHPDGMSLPAFAKGSIFNLLTPIFKITHYPEYR
jgi:hypothetical protein